MQTYKYPHIWSLVKEYINVKLICNVSYSIILIMYKFKVFIKYTIEITLSVVFLFFLKCGYLKFKVHEVVELISVPNCSVGKSVYVTNKHILHGCFSLSLRLGVCIFDK